MIGSVTTADRQPCIGAWVKILPTQANRPLETGPPARTDGAGKYRLEGLTPGPLSIEATLTGHTRAVRETDLHLGVNELDLVLGDGQTVAGMVTDQSGAPIPNASVQLRSPGQNWSMLFAESGQDGTFVIEGVEDGEFIPTARADGFAPYTHDGRIHIAGESRTGLTIRMQPAVSISGRVTGVDPVDYPLVRLNVTGPGAWYNGIGIDHEGGYRIDNLTRGDYRVTASLEGRGTQVSRSVTIDAGVREAHLDLEFGEGLALGGRALIGTAPVRGASVFITGASGRQAGWGRTDSTGSFRIGGLEPATYTLQLRQFETGLVYAEEVLLEASRDIEVRVPVTRLRGHLIDAATFQPLQGVRADLEPVAYGEEHSTAYFMSRTATSDSSGQFSIDNLSSGTWTLSLSRAGYAARSLEIQLTDEHQDDLKIELSPTEGLVLNIRLASGRYPDFVRIAALDGSGRAIVQGRFSTGEQGKVHLASLPPGNWELLLATGGAATTRIDVTTPAGPLSLSLEPPTGLEISLPDLDPDAPPATLTIVDASGHPFRSIDWDGSPRSHWSIGSDGSEFQTLPAGTWTIRVEDTEGSTWERNVATAPGSIARIDLR